MSSSTRSGDVVEFLRGVCGDDEVVQSVVSTFASWDQVRGAGVPVLMRLGLSHQAASVVCATEVVPPVRVPDGGRVVTKYVMSYPAGVRELAVPPVALFVQGVIPEGPLLAVGGSSKPSPVGVEVARAAAAAVNELGVACVWVADGGVGSLFGADVDPALSVMVLPHGVDVPSVHGYWAAEVRGGGGAVVSACGLGVGVSEESVLLSQRVAAAWGECVLVPEFSLLPSSGLEFVRTAVGLNRLLMVPERVHDSAEPAGLANVTVSGTHMLESVGGLDPELFPAGSRAALRGLRGLPAADFVVSGRSGLVDGLREAFGG